MSNTIIRLISQKTGLSIRQQRVGYLWRILALSICLIFTLAGTAKAQFAGGTGTEEEPYLVATAEHLDSVRNHLQAHFLQTADIDLGTAPWNEGEGWMPIGQEGSSFSGSYNGSGHIIRNLFINRPGSDHQGLFGYITSASISNLALTDVSIAGKDRVGALAGHGYHGDVSRCYVTGSVEGNDNVGGLMGYNDASGNEDVWISESYTTAAVTGNRYIGGLVGHNIGLIAYSYSTGSVNGSSYVGGLTGRNISTVWSSFWDMDTSSWPGSSGGKGLTSAQMKTLSVFQNAGWSDTEWVMQEGEYPRLAWEGTGADPIPGPEPFPLMGSGTEEDPYQVSTAEELALLSWFSDVLDAHLVLTSDLDLTGVSLNPFGDLGQFNGVFDGNGYTIDKVTIHQPQSDYVGLFSSLGFEAEVRDLKLINFDIHGRNRVGALAGYMSGDYEIIGSIPEGYDLILHFSRAVDCEADGTVEGLLFVGGLVGMVDRGKVIDCRAGVDVSGHDYVGGLLGGNWFGIVSGSSSDSQVTGQSDRVGGLAGYLMGIDVFQHIDGEYKLGSFTDSHASGSVSGNDLVGGLVGESTGNGAQIINCSSSASVEGNDYLGGLVGMNAYDALIEESSSTGLILGSDQVGGLVGINTNNSVITNSHSANTVQGMDYVGGLVGINESGSSISLSYSISVVNAENRVGGLVGVQHSASIQRSFSAGKTTANNWFAGGLVAENQSNSSINNCYSTSKVTGTAQLGGLVAWNTHGNIINSYATGKITGSPKGGLVQSSFVGDIIGSYWDRESTETDTSAGGESRTTEEMTFPYDSNTFADWDFSTIWAADEDQSRNFGYPHLRGVTPEPGTISVSADPVDGGTTGGGGTFPLGTEITVTADPAENYHFVNWTENGQAVSSQTEYTFIVAGDRDLTANFALDQYEISVSASPENAGDVSGGGTYSHGDQAEVIAVPAENYRFMNWTENGAIVSTSAAYSFTVEGPRDLVAVFNFEIVFEGGTGTEQDPFLVAEPLHLYSVRAEPEAYFRQTADIDLDAFPWNQGEGWLPVGHDHDQAFNGYFDGNGFVIHNLFINRHDWDALPQGLFGIMSGGEIRNVVLENVDIRGYGDVGSLVGIQQDGLIFNCHSSGQVRSEWHGIGGLVGIQQGGEIEYCSSSVEVNGGYGIAGGLAGGSGGTIKKSFATGPVIGGWYAGGFVGRPSTGLIEDCYSTGPVTDPDGWGPVGGFAGGERWGDLGEMNIRNSFATGAVNAGDEGEAGGFVAVWGDEDEDEDPGVIEQSFWDIQTTGQQQSAGGEGVAGKTTDQMMQQATFAGWDFNNTWAIDEGISYPYLQGYSPIISTGSLQVFIAPQEAVAAGAQWRRMGTDAWFDSEHTEDDVSVGMHIVEFKGINGWTEPAHMQVDVEEDSITTITGTYTEYGSLTVVLSQEAIDAGVMWRIAGTDTWYYSGEIVELPVGQYIIEFSGGWRPEEEVVVTVEEGETTVVEVELTRAAALPGVLMLLLDE